MNIKHKLLFLYKSLEYSVHSNKYPAMLLIDHSIAVVTVWNCSQLLSIPAVVHTCVTSCRCKTRCAGRTAWRTSTNASWGWRHVAVDARYTLCLILAAVSNSSRHYLRHFGHVATLLSSAVFCRVRWLYKYPATFFFSSSSWRLRFCWLWRRITWQRFHPDLRSVGVKHQ